MRLKSPAHSTFGAPHRSRRDSPCATRTKGLQQQFIMRKSRLAPMHRLQICVVLCLAVGWYYRPQCVSQMMEAKY